jgi:hypothetical protein
MKLFRPAIMMLAFGALLITVACTQGTAPPSGRYDPEKQVGTACTEGARATWCGVPQGPGGGCPRYHCRYCRGGQWGPVVDCKP